MRLLAPAKINLHLRVGPPRDDGFHPLLSWMCTVGLFDTLTLEQSPHPGVCLTCDESRLPTDDTNLVVRAGALLASSDRARSSDRVLGAQVALEKRIPMGAGLGGGSSDAASALLGLDRLWELGMEPGETAALAGRLGSDVPFFLHAPSAWCEGRGEIVRPIALPRPAYALLILPAEPIYTPGVYKRFDALSLGDPGVLHHQPAMEQWTALSALQLLPLLVNDLEPAAFSLAPAVGRLRDSAEGALSRIVRMSGSGSTLFTLYDEEGEAMAGAEIVRARLETPAMVVRLGVVGEQCR